jgi:hypothetical protein
VRSGPGAARTILLFHTISDRPSKQPRMVGSTLGVYIFGLIFVSAALLQEQIKDIIVIRATQPVLLARCDRVCTVRGPSHEP